MGNIPEFHNLLESYLKEVSETTASSDATEESYYSHLRALFQQVANGLGFSKTHITILPKKTEAGNPDFRIWDGNQHIVGYIEAKVPGADLDKIENTPQLQRYRSTFHNLFLTDFYEFRLYRNGRLLSKVCISDFEAFPKSKFIIVRDEGEFAKLLEKFYSFTIPKAYTSESLALELAKRTRFLKDEVIIEELREEKLNEALLGFYEAFKKYLIAGVTIEEFADLYSQTITYGLFAARTRAGDQFNRKLAYSYIPQTIGILRDVFSFISLGRIPAQMEVIIDDISEVLLCADIDKILSQYYKAHKGQDPIIHFYETFLAEYSPETREKRGVYYTHEPIVNYIVKSLNEILIHNFGKADGFADTSVKVLDPASGTLTFLVQTTKLAIESFVAVHGEGGKDKFIKEHILKSFFAFELMMAPYAIGHMKMGLTLEGFNYKLQDDDRFQLFLTNTLEIENIAQTKIPGMASLSEESKQAAIIKKDKPILALLGNPPYSVASYNKSEEFDKLMALYKQDVKGEKNIQILTDDYVKFIRFCHWKIEQTNTGVIGLITKNTYLSAMPFKGMRQQLLGYFDSVYILNLHGRLYEKAPDGSKDQSVFNIRVGTAIMLLVKDNSKTEEWASLHYAECYGTRESKFKYLNENTYQTTKWERLPVDTDYFFFEKKPSEDKDLYNSFTPLDYILRVNISGIKTHRDHFITADSKTELKSRLEKFIDLPVEAIKTAFNLEDRGGFSVAHARQGYTKVDDDKFQDYAFKPFRNKTIYYDPRFITRDRFSVMQSFISGQPNIGLVVKKRFLGGEYTHCFVTDKLTDINFLGGGSYIFPLHSYSGNIGFAASNIHPIFEDTLNSVYAQNVSANDILQYIYAILHSKIYRRQFSGLLKIDFPKIPFPKVRELFNAVSKLGGELIKLHLLSSSELSKPNTKLLGDGNCVVQSIRYKAGNKRLYINDSQYFSNVSKAVWEFEVGKNRIIQQYIKDRKDKVLSLADMIQFYKITNAVEGTLDIQTKIDGIYPAIIADTIKVNLEKSKLWDSSSI